MDDPGDWMQRPTDVRILEAFTQSDMILSPAVIAKNIGRSREEVNRRLAELTDHGYVERVGRGYYEIVDTGEQFIQESLDDD